MSIYKHRKLPQRPAENGFYAHLRSERSHVEHLFQHQLVRSRRFIKSNSSTFKDPQEPSINQQFVTYASTYIAAINMSRYIYAYYHHYYEKNGENINT